MSKKSLICNHCNKSFERSTKKVNAGIKNGQTLFFCSSACSLEYKTIYKAIKCLNCEQSFIPKTSKGKFCSQSCSATYNNKNSINVIMSRKKKINKCVDCQVLIYSQVKRCKKCYESNYLVDENQTLQDLKSKRTYQSHSRIRNLARRKYEKSNKPKECYVCKYDTHYEVCHIKAIKDHDLNTKLADINHIDNLIAMCPTHHWEFDNGILVI